MPEICGIIADLRREDQGVYEFKKLTLLGYNSGEDEIKKLVELGFKVSDENSKFEGVEITNSSPFQLMRTLAKEFGYKTCKPCNYDAPCDRQSIAWTCISGEPTLTVGIVADLKRECEGEYIIPRCTVFGLEQEEMSALKEKGFKITDENRRVEGVEISGASPFMVMRVLCRDHGWSTDGEIVQLPAPGDRTAAMWTLTKNM